MQLLNMRELHLYALYLNFGLTRQSAYQAITTIREVRGICK